MSSYILVTGGAGFIGSNLCKRLIAEGQKVIALDNFYTGRKSNLKDIINHPNFSVIEHDITLPINLNLDISQIYNAACPASPPAYQGIHSIETTKTCVLGAINVLELAKEKHATVLQFSTSEVYGDPLIHPQTEEYRGNVNPNGIRSCYDEGKRVAESLFFDYHRLYNIPIKVIRIFNTYGPLMDPKDGRVVSNFICQALRGEDLTLYGEGNQTRSFCYVDDLLDGIVSMMNSRSDFTGPVNLGNPTEFTIKQLATMVLELTNSKSEIVYKPLPSDDPKLRRPDISKANKELGYKPHISLREGLIKTIPYFAEELNITI